MSAGSSAAGGRVRVMHVINAMNLGGAEMVVLEHVRQAGPDIETHLCAVNEGGWAMQEAERLGARPLVLGKQGGRLGAIRRLAGYLRRERIDVVNGHNPSGGFYAALAGRLAGVPVIVRTEHSVRHPGKHAGIYDGLLEPVFTAMTHRVVCVCEAVRRSQVRRMRWASRRFVTVMNGIASAAPADTRAATRAGLGLAADEFAIVTVASLTPAKAQHVLVEAFADVARQAPAARLLFVGDGPLRAPLEAQVRSLGLERGVRFLGTRTDVRDLLAAADLYVLSSVREGLSMSILEAMRAGRAAVVTDVGGNSEAVADGVNGRVVPPSDPRALGAALVAALSDRPRLESWGVAARRRWEAEFTAGKMARDTEALYRSELRRAGRLPAA
jgi:glycosyltransferase involved in cell wall biosynthesis